MSLSWIVRIENILRIAGAATRAYPIGRGFRTLSRNGASIWIISFIGARSRTHVFESLRHAARKERPINARATDDLPYIHFHCLNIYAYLYISVKQI